MTSLSGTGRIRLRRFAATLAATSALFASAAQAEPAKPSDAFVDSIGVNVHFLYANYIDNFDTVIAKMGEIGLRHYRDGIGCLADRRPAGFCAGRTPGSRAPGPCFQLGEG